jgi:hypothetical protein
MTTVLVQFLVRSGTGPTLCAWKQKFENSAKTTTKKKQGFVPWEAFKYVSLVLYAIAVFIVIAGLRIPCFFIRLFTTVVLHTGLS